jgi:hypothetical protein
MLNYVWNSFKESNVIFTYSYRNFSEISSGVADCFLNLDHTYIDLPKQHSSSREK